MTRQIGRSLLWGARLTWWAVRAPFVAARTVRRSVNHLAGALVLATQDTLPCPGCGRTVPLLGLWSCGVCGYTFLGGGFARCRVCGAVPPYLNCRCGLSVKNPAPPSESRR